MSAVAAELAYGESLDAQRQTALIGDFFAKVPAGMLAGAAGSGHKATVTSALPLTGDEQAAVKDDLAKQFAGLTEVAFDVDPGILGGLVVRLGDKVIDGSVQGKMSALRQQLNQ